MQLADDIKNKADSNVATGASFPESRPEMQERQHRQKLVSMEEHMKGRIKHVSQRFLEMRGIDLNMKGKKQEVSNRHFFSQFKSDDDLLMNLCISHL